MCCVMWRIVTILVFSAAFMLLGSHEASVFYSSQEANQVLKIQKRANSFLEEIKPGSLERECREEQCDFEEIYEIFQVKEISLDYWTKYYDGDQCTPNPCFNGTCRDGIANFKCICNEGWEGSVCQSEVLHTNCSIDNGGCEHFCEEAQKDDESYRYCSCASGYRLASNHTSCEPLGEYPCGKIVEQEPKIAKIVGGKTGRKGDSPWQVMLKNSKGKFTCGGTLIHPSWVLTAAHCLRGQSRIKLAFGKYYRRLEKDVQEIVADTLLPHENYSAITSDNDIALLHLAHPVSIDRFKLPICLPSKNLATQELMKEGTKTVVTGWGKRSEEKYNFSSVLQYIEIPLVPRNDCINAMWNAISDNMLCAGIQGDSRDACDGDSGGPMVTKFKSTWFLIGLVSWGEGCGKLDNYGIYTKVSSYLDWIEEKMKQGVSHTN
ncbi:vitamin K-dependent protein C [Varanus komodoensis]|uniref:Vitamin K-dependent protein C n=1 Tax=Varanus komodoensis TaxID=61221 RepID=A0A8D2LDL8_VARKO|nr:vitamin K-dependent protein C [Varanus komodoensis]